MAPGIAEQENRFDLGPPPQSIAELRALQAGMRPLPEQPQPQRAEARSRVNWPVHIAWESSDGSQHLAVAQARQVAASSIYFELDPAARLCSPELLLELEPGQELSLCAVARVVRAEASGGKIGIAVVMEDYCFRAPWGSPGPGAPA